MAKVNHNVCEESEEFLESLEEHDTEHGEDNSIDLRKSGDLGEDFHKCLDASNESQIKATQVESGKSSYVEDKTEKKRIKIKLLFLVFVIFVVDFVIIAIIFGMKSASEKNGYFANIPWGEDINSVQRKLEKTFLCESFLSVDKDCVAVSVGDYEGMQGVCALPRLYCEDNGTFNRASVLILVEDDSSYTKEQTADRLVEKYNKLFGKAERTGDDGADFKWTTQNSTIELHMLSFIDDFLLLEFKK